MPIVPSRAERTRTLIARLGSARGAERDSAVAQLTLLGPRVVPALRAAMGGGTVAARLGALEVLERLDARDAIPAILALVDDPSHRVALRAIALAAQRPEPRAAAALGGLLSRGTDERRARGAAAALARLHGAGVVEALAPLVDRVVDEDADTRLRLVALDTILGLEPPLSPRTLRPLARRLAASKEQAVAARGRELTGRASSRSVPKGRDDDVLGRLKKGEVGPVEARRWADTSRAGDVPLERVRGALDEAEDPVAIHSLAVVLGALDGPPAIPVLKHALGRLSEAAADGVDQERLRARVAVHTSLAALDSRVALDDLRDLVARRPAGSMPQLLETAAKLGDGSLVPVLARAASEEPSLLEACVEAYRSIARRERLRRTSAPLKKVRPEHRDALEAFLQARRRGP